MASLLHLPTEALGHVLTFAGSTVQCCASLRATSLGGAVSEDLARSVARHLGLDLPRRAAPTTRDKSGQPFASYAARLSCYISRLELQTLVYLLFRMLAACERRRGLALATELDRSAWQLWMALHKGDCAAKSARRF
jgi:hypothetical protein